MPSLFSSTLTIPALLLALLLSVLLHPSPSAAADTKTPSDDVSTWTETDIKLFYQSSYCCSVVVPTWLETYQYWLNISAVAPFAKIPEEANVTVTFPIEYKYPSPPLSAFDNSPTVCTLNGPRTGNWSCNQLGFRFRLETPGNSNGQPKSTVSINGRTCVVKPWCPEYPLVDTKSTVDLGPAGRMPIWAAVLVFGSVGLTILCIGYVAYRNTRGNREEANTVMKNTGNTYTPQAREGNSMLSKAFWLGPFMRKTNNNVNDGDVIDEEGGKVQSSSANMPGLVEINKSVTAPAAAKTRSRTRPEPLIKVSAPKPAEVTLLLGNNNANNNKENAKRHTRTSTTSSNDSNVPLGKQLAQQRQKSNNNNTLIQFAEKPPMIQPMMKQSPTQQSSPQLRRMNTAPVASNSNMGSPMLPRQQSVGPALGSGRPFTIPSGETPEPVLGQLYPHLQQQQQQQQVRQMQPQQQQPQQPQQQFSDMVSDAGTYGGSVMVSRSAQNERRRF